MNAKPVIFRQRAALDVDDAIAFYLADASADVALGFIDDLERACLRIALHPASGSSRYAHELDLQDLRAWPLSRYPHVVFYVDDRDRIDVWRVLHGKRDIPTWMLQT